MKNLRKYLRKPGTMERGKKSEVISSIMKYYKVKQRTEGRGESRGEGGQRSEVRGEIDNRG